MELGLIERELATVVAAFDPSSVPVSSVVSTFESFDRIERLAASAKTLLACRLEETSEFQRSGQLSPAEFLAAKSGTSLTAAKEVLATSAKVPELPVVAEALRAGALSNAQAVTITNATSHAPAAQARLVDEAKKSSLRELRDEALRVKAAADPDRETTHSRIHAERSVRTYTDAEGAWNLHARGTAADGGRIEAALRPYIEAEFERARTEQRREALEAYLFDALVAAVGQSSPADDQPERLRFLGLLRVDVEALQRNDVADDEICEITGIGPIPVSTARAMLGESILKLVITKGVNVLHVTHLGRGPSAAQMVALLWQNPTCIVEGCPRTLREADHREDFRRTNHTRLDELELLCYEHHDKKTYEGWALVEGVGKRPLVPPDDPRHPNQKNKPPP
jgi:Domain of unknown function (DUF222)